MLRDVLVALVALGLTLALLAGAHGSLVATHGTPRQLDALGSLLAAIACLPLLAHRRWPLEVFVLSTAANATINGLGYGLGPPFGPTVALFYLAADGRTRERLAQAGAVVVGMAAVHVGATALSEPGFPTTPILGAIVLWGGAWIVGDQVSQRRQRHAALIERARGAERDLERERRLAAAEERTRIARDLHDSAAHAINVILVQAGGARLLQDRDPHAVREALQTIEDLARETISDIDQIVHGLRDDDPAHDTVEPPIGLAAAQTLAARHRAAGLAVTITTEGPARRLPPSVDQAAYRIVQESLTNAARHGAGTAEVSIRFGARELELQTTNALTPDASNRRNGGHGLQGMRERAALLGGSVTAGPDGRAFTVHARLPYVPRRP